MNKKESLPLPDRILRKKEYADMLGVSATSFWRMEKAGLTAPRRQISPGVHGYLYSECLEKIKAA